MSDQLENTDQTVDIDAVVPESQDTDTASVETDWKSEARKWEKRAKDANALREDADKWREYEASLKPAQERLAEELATSKAEAESARATLLRYEVANDKGIPADALRLLTGSTREELEESADTLLALIATQSKQKPSLPDGNQGQPAPSTAGQITDRNLLKDMTPAEVMKAKADGRLDSMLGK
jgi:hypothetical protein